MTFINSANRVVNILCLIVIPLAILFAFVDLGPFQVIRPAIVYTTLFLLVIKPILTFLKVLSHQNKSESIPGPLEKSSFFIMVIPILFLALVVNFVFGNFVGEFIIAAILGVALLLLTQKNHKV